MAPAVGRVRMAWTRGDVRAMRRATAWADRVARWAEGWERAYDQVSEWAEATEVRGVPLATRLGITVDRATRPVETIEPEGSEA
jgi:Xaa-Pro aminopeptidase